MRKVIAKHGQIKMGLTRLGALLGLLCFLVNVAWGVGCSDDGLQLRSKIDDFAEKLTPVPSASQAVHIQEVSQAHIGKTLYCGFVERLLIAHTDPVIDTRLMCLYITKDTQEDSGELDSWEFGGFCLDLYPSSTRSKISVAFKKDVLVLKIDESFIECDHENNELKTLIFKQERDRYVLQSYTRALDGDPDPFYRQKRDGKKIFMDQIDRGVLDALENHCYKKHYCQTWDEKNGIE